MKTGITKAERDMASQGSVMGFVAKEQFSHLTDAEVTAIYDFFTKEWTAARGIEEEKKIAIYFKPPPEKIENQP